MDLCYDSGNKNGVAGAMDYGNPSTTKAEPAGPAFCFTWFESNNQQLATGI